MIKSPSLALGILVLGLSWVRGPWPVPGPWSVLRPSPDERPRSRYWQRAAAQGTLDQGPTKDSGPGTKDSSCYSTAASSITKRGRVPETRRALTPNGSVIAGVTVWPDGKPMTTGPGKSANSSAITARAVGSPDGSSHF